MLGGAYLATSTVDMYQLKGNMDQVQQQSVDFLASSIVRDGATIPAEAGLSHLPLHVELLPGSA